MTGRQTWTGWPNEGYQWQDGVGYIEQPQPFDGQSNGQRSFFNHPSFQESRDEMLNQSWGFQPQVNHQYPYKPATPTHSSQAYLQLNKYYTPYQEYQQPQTTSHDSKASMMKTIMEGLQALSNEMTEFSNDMKQTIRKVPQTNQYEEPMAQETFFQPFCEEPSHYDDGINV